jgi:DNA-binding transcriptional MerR regulator
MVGLSISELRARTGLAASALRFYERKGLLRAIGRFGGKRFYDERAVEQVAFIDLLKLAGFTLSEIAQLVRPSGRTAPGWRAMAVAKLRQLDDRVQEIERARTALRHMLGAPYDRLDDCPEHHRILNAHAEALATAARSRTGRVWAGGVEPGSAVGLPGDPVA